MKGGNPDGSGIGKGGSVDGIGKGMPGSPGKPGGAASSAGAPASAGRGLGVVFVEVDAGVGAAVGCTGVPMGGSAVGAAVVVAVGGASGAEGAEGAVVAVGRVVGPSKSNSYLSMAIAAATIPIASTLIPMRSQTERRRGPFAAAPGTGGRFA